MGGPFVLTALFLFGSVVFGDEPSGEKLMMIIAGGVFAGAGLLLWVPAFPLLIVTAMVTISGWIAFAPGPRAFESGAANSILGFSWSGGSELLGRAAFGLGAVVLIAITVIGWWKYLRGRW
jgi:hypothetical protein